MTKLFRSKSFAGTPPPTAGFFQSNFTNHKHFSGAGDEYYEGYSYLNNDPVISPDYHHHNQPQSAANYTVLAFFLSAIRKSIVTCAVDESDDDDSSGISSLDIGLPTDVQHVSHVTFDRFDGFLGLPVELQPDVPRKPPSARYVILFYFL